MADSYDCVVIGSGPGGYVAAIRSAQLGMSTAIVEKDRIGGRCLNFACIPAKAVLRAADVMGEVRHADQFGIKVDGASVDFSGVASHRDSVIKTLTSGVSGLMKKNKVDGIEGLEALPHILPLEDEEIAKVAAREIKKQNVEIVTDANIESAEAGDDGVTLKYGGGERSFDYLCIAAGRAPDYEGLGLEEAGIETD